MRAEVFALSREEREKMYESFFNYSECHCGSPRAHCRLCGEQLESSVPSLFDAVRFDHVLDHATGEN